MTISVDKIEMIDLVIPDHERELEVLEDIGNAGFILGLGLKFGKPDFALNRYPDAWTKKYEEENYFFGDPMTLWTMNRTGSVRWSACEFEDMRGVMDEARKHGLAYGATFVEVVKGKRSFLSIGRNDRELTDDEMAMLMTRVKSWASLFANYWKTVGLTQGEVDALASLKMGTNQDEAAEALKISRSALRQRITTAQVKLRAPNTVSAVARAAQMGII
ncbi:helix-turn-helix transcriptional regulator [Paracoccus nototheniae]|uniref:Autoinducer binding domain-containing protein n=1 Tax=Paracoccus nototheniae TaxID=2489002 RepID=A0ABW4DTI2_9RHOB|nr:autoinducer binding domain-containing protein [Paracoccus nototheniae]